MFPFESLSLEHREVGLVVAVLIGFCFGFVLERAGFGRATRLAGQFYFHDLTVFKVMFAAVVTAMLGVVVFDGLGLTNFALIAESVVSDTFVWPMLIGGLMLGAGFIISGYCPGTSVVAAASGHIDGMLTFGGVIIGSYIFSEVYAIPGVEAFYMSGAKGQVFLFQMLGISPAFLAVGIAVVAAAGFVGAEKLEKIFTKKWLNQDAETLPPAPRRFVFASFGVASLAGLALLFLPVGAGSSVAEPPAVVETIDADALARRILDEPWKLRILDLRASEAFTKQRIPGSENAAPDTLGELGFAYSQGVRDLVLVGASDLTEVPDAARVYPGRVLTLTGGYTAWQAFALKPPAPLAADASSEAIAAFKFQEGVHRMMTGARAAPPPPASATRFKPPPRRKGGGCDG